MSVCPSEFKSANKWIQRHTINKLEKKEFALTVDSASINALVEKAAA